MNMSGPNKDNWAIGGENNAEIRIAHLLDFHGLALRDLQSAWTPTQGCFRSTNRIHPKLAIIRRFQWVAPTFSFCLSSRWSAEFLLNAVIVVNTQPNLLHVVEALEAIRGLSDLLNGRQQEPDQEGDDGDDDE